MFNKFTKFFTLIALLYAGSSFAEEITIPGDTDAPTKVIAVDPTAVNAEEDVTPAEKEKKEEIKKEIKKAEKKPAIKEEKKTEEKKEESKVEETKEEMRDEKTEEKPAPKEEEKAEKKDEQKSDEKAEDKKSEEKSEEKADEKSDDKKDEKKSEDKKDESKNEERSDEKKADKEEHKKVEKIKVSSALNESELKVEGITLNKNVLNEIYSPRDFKTIWFDGMKPNANYEQAIEFIVRADENGLDRRYFDIDNIKKRVEDDKQTEDSVAKTDLLISFLITEMVNQVGNGMNIPKDLKLETYFERPVRVSNNANKIMQEFLDSKDDGEDVLVKYQPKNPQYVLLKKALKIAIDKAGSSRGIKPVEYSRDIVPGDKNHTISEIRTRLGVRRSVDPSFEADVYDKALVAKVTEFQEKFKQEQNGIINKDFVEALNKHDVDSISRIKANMERYRWLADTLEPTRVEVNLATFKLVAYKDNKEEFDMGVISGREEHRTPIMSTKMYQFILNPYWNVPKAYFLRNMLPLLKQDPHYVKNQNFDLMKMGKKGWENIEQSSVDWDKVNADNYDFLLRQRPGNVNVLGPIKFAIVNPYDIYLHSTSEPWLFTNKFRGYSSGCIRIEDPVKMANFLIKEGGVDVTEEEFMKLYKAYYSKSGDILPQKKEYNDKYFKFKRPIATYTTYFTAEADDKGNVTFSDDIYNLDFDQAKLSGL